MPYDARNIPLPMVQRNGPEISWPHSGGTMHARAVYAIAVTLASLVTIGCGDDESRTDTTGPADETPIAVALDTLANASAIPLEPEFTRGVARWIGMDVPLPEGPDTSKAAGERPTRRCPGTTTTT